MSYNVGAYLGLGKENAYGSAVAPTVYAQMAKMTDLKASVPQIEVEDYSQFGSSLFIPGLEQADVSGQIVVTPRAIGMLLAGLLGQPTTSGANPAYSHAFGFKQIIPGLTLEARDGAAQSGGTPQKYVVSGVKLSELNLEHDPAGLLTAGFTGMGQSKILAPAPSAPVLETQVFKASSLAVTVGGVALSARVEKANVGIKAGKEAVTGFGLSTIQEPLATGEADVTVSLALRYDDVDRSAIYKQIVGQALGLVWTFDGNTSLAVNLPTAILTDDPQVRANDALGLARVQLSYKGLNFGNLGNLITLRNTQAAY